jgi:hypothetical protein
VWRIVTIAFFLLQSLILLCRLLLTCRPFAKRLSFGDKRVWSHRWC